MIKIFITVKKLRPMFIFKLSLIVYLLHFIEASVSENEITLQIENDPTYNGIKNLQLQKVKFYLNKNSQKGCCDFFELRSRIIECSEPEFHFKDLEASYFDKIFSKKPKLITRVVVDGIESISTQQTICSHCLKNAKKFLNNKTGIIKYLRDAGHSQILNSPPIKLLGGKENPLNLLAIKCSNNDISSKRNCSIMHYLVEFTNDRYVFHELIDLGNDYFFIERGDKSRLIGHIMAFNFIDYKCIPVNNITGSSTNNSGSR